LGFFLFREQEKNELNTHIDAISAIREKVTQAESMMILKNSNQEAAKEANNMLTDAWTEILPLAKLESGKDSQATELKLIIETDLESLNNLVKIADPIEAEDPEKENLFLPQNQINSLVENYQLKLPHPEAEFTAFTEFNGNFYFLDSKAGEIIRYPAPIQTGRNNPQLWLKTKVLDAKSIAVDGAVWVLDGNNQILRYRSGNLQQTLKPTLFPQAKNFSKIYISEALPYLFILEPEKNRIIILQKTGQIFKQFQSEKFNNLSDLSVSQDGKTLYILNGLTVYKIAL